MIPITPSLAQQIAQFALTYQTECTGRAPSSVTVVLGEDTLVVTFHEALSPAELDLSRTPEGAAKVREFHRQLFQSCSARLHAELQNILGVKVTESSIEIEPATKRLVEVLPSGAVVQVFHLATPVAAQSWSSPSPLITATAGGPPSP